MLIPIFDTRQRLQFFDADINNNRTNIRSLAHAQRLDETCPTDTTTRGRIYYY